ncbi:hypothetical protein AB832_07050 [Flavobacteriaceae bacterium (ex Bugula neritina AB1)]|nr:hypothetical protein AB832_07050 [Flavobacteriaceae bacterium (ex Bugula neritina AB1)]
MYCLTVQLKWVSIENAGDWEGIKESFVDQDKNVFDKKIKQYYHREIKKPQANNLIIKDINILFDDFFKRFPDRKRTQDGR